MFEICPKCSHERVPRDKGPEWQCPKCGIVYAKFVPADKEGAPAVPAPVVHHALEPRDPSANKPLIIAAVAVVVVIIVVLGFLASRQGTKPPAEVKAATPSAETTAPISDHTLNKKITGFEDLTWGMDDHEIKTKLGARVENLANTESFKNAYAKLTINNYSTAGVMMQVFFQMNHDSRRLSRILLTKNSTDPKQRAFALEYDLIKAELSKKFGPGKALGDTKHQWLHGNTVIKLDDFYQEGVFERLTLLYRPYDE